MELWANEEILYSGAVQISRLVARMCVLALTGVQIDNGESFVISYLVFCSCGKEMKIR